MCLSNIGKIVEQPALIIHCCLLFFYWCEMSCCVILASTFKAFLCVQYHVAFTNDRNSGETEEKIRKTQDTKKKRKSETPPERQ